MDGVVPNSVALKYTISSANDTTELFKSGGGLIINDQGRISGTPIKGQTGYFKITATARTGTL
jgi:hypothetical protein